MTISVAWFDHVRDTAPKTVVTKWDSFADKLEAMAQTERDISEKQRSPLVSPAMYHAGGRRRNQDVQGFGGWFAIDIDDADCTLQEASDFCCMAEISHVIWTTTSHTDDEHRFRVAFPLNRDVAPDEMVRFWAGTHAYFKGWGDIKTKDPARMMIAPAKWRGSGAQFIRVDGLGPLSVDEVLVLAPDVPAPRQQAAVKHPAPVNRIVASLPERAKAELAIQKWKHGILTKVDLQGVKAQHLVPDNSKSEKHGRGREKLAAAKMTLDRMQRAAK